MTGAPITAETPVKYPGTVPDRADLIVIGAGVIGVCTALFAARGGANVVVLEKGRVAAEQSSRNWGWIRQQGRDPAELPIMVEANRIWQELDRETNDDFGLVRGGVTYFARDEAAMARYGAFVDRARPHGVDSRLMTGAEVAAAYPDMRGAVAGALTTPSDMRAEPARAVPALAGIAVREGVRIVENCAVRCLDVADRRITGVMTEHGRIAAPRVVLAGGAWSSLLLRNHGISMPQLSVRETVAATQPLPDIGQAATYAKGVAFRRRADGGFTIAPPGAPDLFIGPDAFRALRHYIPQIRSDPSGHRLRARAPRGFPDAWSTPRRWSADAVTPFERMRVLDPAPDLAKIDTMLRAFEAMFPKLGRVQARATWAGMIDTMPDIVPIVDHGPLDGLIIGTGMSGHGFGIGPAMGRILADLAADRPVGHDLTRFRFNRFTDGSKIDLGPDN
ncbi:FAD-binding oxidoreductase [Sulfitobacter sp. S190]|uniref:NAD(P)/FAD-dependent oxidoreductase n=1 Tax=Sulfitobacter sp. S190 TaxID=2867022 RepID=UPI0021A3D736|nr:FAD-binding oxidoreductase [Sulfitobacter sp. S190]UWR23663.1 FAD-binding oxidoreductase [Sulfitobacter sp. S190]